MQLKRQLYTIILIFALIFPLVVLYCCLQYRKTLIKHEVKQKITEDTYRDKLVLLKFTKKQSEMLLHWEHPREFEYNGEMYDVAESYTAGDTIYYRCWLDEMETVLNRQLKVLMEEVLQNDPERQRKQARLITFLKSLYLEEVLTCKFGNIQLKQKLKAVYSDRYKSISYKPPDPPPKKS